MIRGGILSRNIAHIRFVSAWTQNVLRLEIIENDVCSASLVQNFDDNLAGILENGRKIEMDSPTMSMLSPVKCGVIPITIKPFIENYTSPLRACRHFVLFPPRIMVFFI
jgi:hypothetical protein